MKTVKTKKNMPRGVPFKQGYDERRNLLGAPKRGESNAETLDKLMNMTPAEVLELIGKNNDLGRAFAQYPSDVPNKVLVWLRNIAAEMFEPSAGRMNMITERLEGKVSTPLEIGGKSENALTITIRKASDESGTSDQ